jgi:hypothetical protein
VGYKLAKPATLFILGKKEIYSFIAIFSSGVTTDLLKGVL